MIPCSRFASVAFYAAIVLASFSFASCSDSGNGNLAAQPGTTPPTSTPSSTPPSGTPLRTGKYGGNNVQVTVNSDGADIKFACAKGNIPHPIETDSNGAFDVQGTYQSTSGPVPQDGYPVYAAEYSGAVSGDTLDFNINYTDGSGNPVHQNHTATYGQTGVFTVLCAQSEPSPSHTP
jgi:hypothetical protein